MTRLLSIVLGGLLICPLAKAQVFEVATIRPHAPDDARFLVRFPVNGRFTATGATARLITRMAYDVQEDQLIGGPSWFATDQWDIQAESGNPATRSAGDTRLMLQKLLENRFGLRVHRENRNRPAYVLTVGKGGPKFQADESDGPTDIHVTATSIETRGAELSKITQTLSTALGRTVVDGTGLKGRYSVSLAWDEIPGMGNTPGAEPSLSRNEHGSIFTAVEEQLGLRLEARHAEVQTIVVDRIERPSEN